MKIKQLSIFLQNKMGSLAKPLEVLTVADVNIRAMCTKTTFPSFPLKKSITYRFLTFFYFF